MSNKSSRTFTISIKPHWEIDQIENFVNSMIGTATVFAITHDKDTDKEGNLIEPHTHILLDYNTPRKISTVANLFNVEQNFIELVRNKKGMLRYLTHMDEPDKHRYLPEQVITNNSISYELTVLGNGLSDKDIADYIIQGKGMDLIGIVPIGRLRTIQGFIHFDQSNVMIQQIKDVNGKLDTVLQVIENVEIIATAFITDLKNGIQHSTETLTSGMIQIAQEIGKSAKIIHQRKR